MIDKNCLHMVVYWTNVEMLVDKHHVGGDSLKRRSLSYLFGLMSYQFFNICIVPISLFVGVIDQPDLLIHNDGHTK